jgi:hypothetical protein
MTPQEEAIHSLTLNERRSLAELSPLEESLPEEFKFFGKIIGDLIPNESMIEINKMVVEAHLSRYKADSPLLFSNEISSKITTGFVVGQLCMVNNKGVNDVVAHLLKQYFSMVEEFDFKRVLN